MICNFSSERTCKLHKEYLEKIKLQYTILEKSFPCIVRKDIFDIRKMRLKYKDEILSLKCDIMCHELFFDSFGQRNQSSGTVIDNFGSEAAFLYEIFSQAKKAENCFAFICLHGKRVNFSFGMPELLLKLSNPVLTLDLCEHAYFLDYGFDREEYLRRMLPYLNLNKLT